MRNCVDIFRRVYHETAGDYFRQLGGAGRYDGYHDWHAMALTITLGIRSLPGVNEEALRLCLRVLPRDLTQGCDYLSKVVEVEFQKFQATLNEQWGETARDGVWDLWCWMKADQTGLRINDFSGLLYQALFSDLKHRNP